MRMKIVLLIFIITVLSIIPNNLFSIPETNNVIASLPTRINPQLINSTTGAIINPYIVYSQEPAPMGIADYGLSPSGAYILKTTQWLGDIYIYYLSARSSVNTPEVSFQLNVVLNYQYNGYTYALWVQNVLRYDTQSGKIFFVNNIWNFTKINASVTGVYGNGRIYPYQGVTFYAYFTPSTHISLPARIYLLVNVTTNYLGQPVIYFWYNIGYGWVNYDIVTVANVYSASNVYFLVNGYQYTGSGHFYDAELVMGGPYGGASAYLYSAEVYLSLYYWNGNNFQEVRNAYNFGSDTAETVNNAYATTYYYPMAGKLVVGIFAGSGVLKELWNEGRVSQLIIHSNVYSGYVYVYNISYPYSTAIQYRDFFKIHFTGGTAILTLYPMNYAVLVYDENGQLVGEANVATYYGGTTSTYVTKFQVSVSPEIISVQQGTSTSVQINVYAYGYVYFTISSSSPSISIDLSQNPAYINGQGNVILTINTRGTPIGTYTLVVNASLFPGFYITRIITVNVILITYQFKFIYYTIGSQSPPYPPRVTFQFPNGSTISTYLYNGSTILLPLGTNYTIQDVILVSNNIRFATDDIVTGTINGPKSVFIKYYQQYLVTFSYLVQNGEWNLGGPTVTYYSFGRSYSTTTPSTVWVDSNSVYSYSKLLPGFDNRQRAITYQDTGVVNSPGSIVVPYYVEYYITVNSKVPVYAIINNANTTLTSGWYNSTTRIMIENLTYYVNQGERLIISSILPSLQIVVNFPINIFVYTTTQYYVRIYSSIPLYALVNGINSTITSGWYNEGTTLKILNLTYYKSPQERIIITYISPSSYIIVNSSITLMVNTMTQYYVSVTSIIPVKALINGTTTTILNSSWINANTRVSIVNYTYYVNEKERYIIVNISPSKEVIVNKSYNINLAIKKQYLVTINGVSNWYDEGSSIQLNADIPFYQVGKFVGTYNVTPGSYIVVNKPIVETLVLSPNYPVIASIIIGVIAVSLLVTLLLLRKRKEGEEGGQ